MEFEITGKVALITEGLSDLGYNFAKQLLTQGLKAVALLDVDVIKGEIVLKEFREKFGADSCIFVATDVSDQSQIKDAFELTVHTFKHLDIVINNAGIISEVDWKKCLDTNLGGCMAGTVLAFDIYLPKFKKGPEGVVLNIASKAAIDPLYSLPIYSATKHGIVGLCRAYGAKEHYEATKVKIIAICSGVTATGMLKAGERKPEYGERFNKAAKRPSFQTPEFVASATVDIIRNGQNGSVWVIEDTKPAYEVEYQNHANIRKQGSNENGSRNVLS